MTGTIFDIKEMAVHDGLGIRTTVFFKGCPLRCRWCHNPEGFSREPQLFIKEARCKHCKLCYKPCNHPECQPFGRCLHICPENCLTITGRTVSVKALADELKKTAEPLGGAFGGFTFSGGEPLFQYKFLLELIEELKDFNLCIETSGYAEQKVFKDVVDNLDYVIMDVKIADDRMHRTYTGKGNEIILDNLKYLKQSGKPHIFRTPIIHGITDTQENLSAIKEIIGDSEWEHLPYNSMAGAKWHMLKMDYPLDSM